MTKTPLSKRAKARLAKMRREPFGRLALEVGRYLDTVGWHVVVVGHPQVRGFDDGTVGRYEFVVHFTGAKSTAIQKAKKPSR